MTDHLIDELLIYGVDSVQFDMKSELTDFLRVAWSRVECKIPMKKFN